MKKSLFISLIIFPIFAFGQFGVSFHQSNLPFIGLNYQFDNNLRPEIRLGIDNSLYSSSIESILAYNFLKRDDYDLYGGIGARINGYSGLVIPIGINIYPLTKKEFGFHIEFAPLISETKILRGSWGIRYNFNRKKK